MSYTKNSPAYERAMQEQQIHEFNSYEEYRSWLYHEEQKALKSVPSEKEKQPGNSAQTTVPSGHNTKQVP